MSDIQLNFISLKNIDLTVNVFRKEYQLEEELPLGVHVFRLPDAEGEYKQFFVSFSDREGYEEFSCRLEDNNDLSKRYLFEIIKRSLADSSSINYSLKEKGFTTTIDLTYQETELGDQVVTFTPHYLKSSRKLGLLVDFKFNMKDDVPFSREVQRYSLSLDNNYRSNKNFYSDKYRIITSVLNDTFSQILPIIHQGQSVDFHLNFERLPSQQLNKKTYIMSNSREAYSQFHGVKNYGVYKKVEETEVLYCFVFEAKYRSFANDIFLSLMGKSNPGTFPGMKSMFDLPFSKEDIKGVNIATLDIENLEKAKNEIVELKQRNPEKRVIAILLEETGLDDREHVNSPYYYFKYHMLQSGIPVQALTHEKLGDKNSLKWSTSNFGLQIFSKLGGIPWIVKPSNNNCLILGIGSAHQIDDETRSVQKYMAYSVCMDSSGLYKKLAILSESESHETYLEGLRQNVLTLLQEQEFSNYSKVVLHVPFKIKRDEIEKLQEALAEINNIEFKVIKVNLKNKFFGYSDHNTCVPYESSYIKLSRNEYLVWFEGLQYGKGNLFQRVGNPVHIEFMNSDNPEEDKPYLQDVLNLSGANWRGFNAKSIPISIYYSRIIAEYTSVFENFEGFEQSLFETNKPWFL